MLEEPFDFPDQPRPVPPRMPLGRVVGINFAITLVYMTLSGAGKGEASLGSLMADAFLLVGQVAVNIIGGVILLFMRDHRPAGRAMLLAGLLVGIIGAGMCVGKWTVFG